MTFQTRWWLPMAMASSLVVACGSSGGGGGGGATVDAGTDTPVTSDITATDAPADRPADATTDRVTPPVDRPAGPNPCAAPTDISSMMPRADGAIHIMGDNGAGAPVQLGALPMGCPLGTSGGDKGYKGNVVVYRYTMRATGLLRVSTNNPGTEEGFDTVVAVLATCSATGASLACSDDVGGGNLTSTATTSAPVMMGQSVFIVVGGWGTDPAKAAQGTFELTVAETAPVAIGGACMAGSVCASGSACVPNVGSTTMGTCLANGANRGLCRVMAPNCDTGLSCTAAEPTAAAPGQCLPPAGLGEPCGAVGICSMGNVCPNFIAPATVTPPPRPVDAGSDAAVDATAPSDVTATDAASADVPASDAGAPTDAGAPVASRRCVAPVAEVEPNNSQMAAQAAVTTSTTFRAGLTAGDVDCFAVTVPVGTTISAETHDATGTCNLGDGADTIVRVYSMGGAMPIAENDDIAMGNLCSRLPGTTAALTRVPAGTYQVCVSGYAAADAGSTPIMNYYLTIGLTN